MQRNRTFLVIMLLCWIWSVPGCRDRPAVPVATKSESLTVAETLGSRQETGFARACQPRRFVFPADHGPHPEFQTEWWYFTGNLASTGGRRFGYQLTFFRFGLLPEPPDRVSEWAAHQIFMAHFAITDALTGDFYHFERFSRGALGLAGASAEPFRVWLEDWSVAGEGQGTWPMRLQADTSEVAIDLLLEAAKPPVLQGDQGLSRKSAEPGNASYYYSLTRLPTWGEIRIGRESFETAGSSWLDREWSTSALGENQVGWDWFSLQLDDGRDLMFYQLRLEDGSADPLSSGVLVAPDGTSRRLFVEDVQIDVLAHWLSPHSGVSYPAHWRLQVPGQQLDLEIRPLIADQELLTTVRYWEGAVSVRNLDQGPDVRGRGYVELTGYTP